MTGGFGSTTGSSPHARRSAPDRIGGAVRDIPAGLIAAFRDARSGQGLAWTSPAVATLGAYVGFYVIGLMLSSPSPRLPVIALAVALGLAGLLAGIGLGWGRTSTPQRAMPVGERLLTLYARALLATGLLALAAYLIAIGYIPLFQPGLEQTRVDAAEQGGAPLRVLALLALPGSWILVAQAAHAGSRRRLLVAVGWLGIVAVGFMLTGNRSPAFATLETGLIAGLLGAGRARLGRQGVALLALAGIVLVIAAGLFGAFRLASQAEIVSPPNSYARAPDYPALTAIAIKGYLVVPVQNLQYTMDAVPGRIGWRFGTTYLQPLLTVLPGKQLTFDADLKAALNQKYAGGGTVPGLLGEAYANFGPLGWFLVPLLVGAAITGLYKLGIAGTPEGAALYGFAIAHVSVGGVLSGLFVASVFPFEAYFVLGFGVVGLPRIARLVHARRAGRGI